MADVQKSKIIKVLIVEDSPFVCKVLINILNTDPEILVVGTAADGRQAVELTMKLRPDIITMDIQLPVMDGLEATKQIMAYRPTPILVVSATIFKGGTDKVFKAIYYGALDIMDKDRLELVGEQKFGEDLIAKVKFLSTVKVMPHPLAKFEKGSVLNVLKMPAIEAQDSIVVFIVSTGGPQALLEILGRFPKDFPCGIVVVQHIVSGFVEGLVDWLDKQCQIKIKVAEDSEGIKPGIAYIAPCNFQMRIRADRKIGLSDEPARGNHRPSGDILLESVARAYKDKAIGVILTGMGRDGAEGIRMVKQARGRTIAQDEKSSVVFGMPKAAIDMGVVDKVLPLEKIAPEIIGFFSC